MEEEAEYRLLLKEYSFLSAETAYVPAPRALVFKAIVAAVSGTAEWRSLINFP